MSLGFNEKGDLEDKPDGYFKGTRQIVSYEYEIPYKGKATEATGREWVKAVMNVCIAGFFPLILLVAFLLDLNIPNIILVFIGLFFYHHYTLPWQNCLKSG